MSDTASNSFFDKISLIDCYRPDNLSNDMDCASTLSSSLWLWHLLDPYSAWSRFVVCNIFVGDRVCRTRRGPGRFGGVSMVASVDQPALNLYRVIGWCMTELRRINSSR